MKKKMCDIAEIRCCQFCLYGPGWHRSGENKSGSKRCEASQEMSDIRGKYAEFLIFYMRGQNNL